MNRSLIIRLSVLFVALMSLWLTSCSKSSVYGTYVSEKNAKDYTELKSDGAFFVQQGSVSFSGKYKVDGKNITLTLDSGQAARGKIDGNTIIDDQGIHWTRK
jgi:hypothetical protein